MGKPMIAWSIEAAKKSKIFDEIIVSTNSKKIANISRKLGAKVPYLRSTSLSKDKTNLIDVVSDIANYFVKKKLKVNFICLIYAASPLILIQDLKKGFLKIKKNPKYDYIISASKLSESYLRSFKSNKGRIYPLFKKNVSKRSQDVQNLYYESGQFIFGKSKSWLLKKLPYLSKTSMIEIDSFRSQDIDDPSDWKRAEMIFNFIKKNKA